MPQQVLLGSRPPEILQVVRDGLEAAGHHVRTADDVESVVAIARSREVDLVIVAEALGGGTGSDVCMVLGRLPGHAPLLYVGDTLVPGADAVAPASDPGRILEQAMLLLEGAALIDSLGDVQNAAAEEEADKEDVPVTKKSRAVPPPDEDDEEDVAVTRVSPAVRAPEPPPAPPPTPAAKSPVKTTGNGAPKPGSLEPLLRAVREADYFEILGVSVEATVEDVKAAHAGLRASLAGMGAPRLQLDEVQAALDEARDVLSEPALRAAYTRNRL